MVVKDSGSRKSRQTGTICKWLGNMVCCHEKQMKTQDSDKRLSVCLRKPFQNKETVHAGCQLTSVEKGDGPTLTFIITNLKATYMVLSGEKTQSSKDLPILKAQQYPKLKYPRLLFSHRFSLKSEIHLRRYHPFHSVCQEQWRRIHLDMHSKTPKF